MAEPALPGVSGSGPEPMRVRSSTDLVRELDLLRQRAARGLRQSRVSLAELAVRTGMPRSTVHAYVTGVHVPPPDCLDALVIALGATSLEQRAWSDALYRVRSRSEVEPVTLPRQLPYAPPMLVGRQRELRRLDALSEASVARPGIVVICGTAGVGKTALALRWAHDVAANFADGQLWLDLAGFGPGQALDPADGIATVLSALGVAPRTLPRRVEDLAALYRSAIAGKRLLIVLDNAGDSSQVIPMLPGSSTTMVLITSRELLRPLLAHCSPRVIALDRLSRAHAEQLLAPSLEHADETVTARLVAHCAGLPLALQIIRSRMSGAMPWQVRDLADRLDLNSAARLDAMDVSDGHSEISVRETLRWSVDALEPLAAAMLRRLPLCYSTVFDVSLAAAALGVDPPVAARLLDDLVRASLVEVVDQDRFRVHDLIAAYAMDMLNDDDAGGDVGEARRRVAALIISAVMQKIRRQEPSDNLHINEPGTPSSEGLTISSEMIATAILDLLDHGELEHAVRLADLAANAFWPTSDGRAIEPAIEAALRRAENADPPLNAVAALHRGLGVLHGQRAELAQAERHFVQAIDWSRRLGLRLDEAKDVCNLAHVWRMRGQTRAAHDAIAAELDQFSSDRALYLLTLRTLVDIALERDDHDAAHQWMSRLIRLDDDGAIPEGAFSLISARVALADDDLGAAKSHVEIALTHALARAAQSDIAKALILRAEIFLAIDNPDDAAADAEAALEIAHELSHVAGEVAALHVLGEAARRRGHSEAARCILADACRRADTAGLQYLAARTLMSLARAEADGGDANAAITAQSRALAIARRCEFNGLIGLASPDVANT